MNNKIDLLNAVKEQKVLPLYYHKDAETSTHVMKALYAAGIRVLEYTNRGETALSNFAEMVKVRDSELPGMALGTGTIKNARAAQAYIDTGTDFIVCPGLVEEVAETADRHNMLWIPGCMTPSEIIRAENLGARMIKLFPGNILGPEFMKAIKSLFPELLFMPTGGVDLDEANMTSWFKAGVSAVGMGSKLISAELLQQKNYDKISDLTITALEMANQIVSQKL